MIIDRRLLLLPLLTSLACSFEVPVRPFSAFSLEDMASPADLAPVFDPLQPGPAPVATLNLTAQLVGSGPQGRIGLMVMGPGRTATSLTTQRAPHPTVVLLPGLLIPKEQYSHIAAQLASWGVITVVPAPRVEWDHQTYRDDVSALVGWLRSPGSTGDALRGMVDGERMGLSGHGLGGKIAILAAASGVKVRSLLTLDAVESPGLGPTLSALDQVATITLPSPMAFVGELTGRDKMGEVPPCAPAGKNYRALYDLSSPPALLLTVVDAGHGDFTDNSSTCGPCQGCVQGSAPRERVRALTLRYATAYFLWTLLGRQDARPFLDAALTDGMPEGSVVREVK